MKGKRKDLEKMGLRELVEYVKVLEAKNAIDIDAFIDATADKTYRASNPDDAKDVIRQAIEYGSRDEFELEVSGDGTTLCIEARFAYTIETRKLNKKGKK